MGDTASNADAVDSVASLHESGQTSRQPQLATINKRPPDGGDVLERFDAQPKNQEPNILSLAAYAPEGHVRTLPNNNDLPHNRSMTEPLTRPELDAKLETIEARMDGRIARIEDRFASMEKTIDQIVRALESQKNVPWKAAAATIAAMIATVIAVAAFGFSAFDSGRETAKMAADARQETAATLSEIRQIVRDLKVSPATQPLLPSGESRQTPKQ